MALTFVPRYISTLAQVAEENQRYACSAMALKVTSERFRAETTNGKVFVRVTGDLPQKEEEYPAIPALANAPNGETEALVPAQAFAKFVKSLPKQRKDAKSCEAAIALALAPQDITFGWTSLEDARTCLLRQVEGRFPDYDQVFPKGAPMRTVRLSVDELLRVLKIFSELADGNRVVDVCLFDAKKPIQLFFGREDGTRIDALIMPCS